MSTPGLRTRFALVVLAMVVVAVAGCSAHPLPAASPAPSRTALSPAQSAASGSAEASAAKASDDAPPDQDGNPACAAYDSWRPGPDGAGITVTYWYDGTAPVTVRVRHGGGPDLSQTVDSDVQQRLHDFEFIDVYPKTVTEVLVTSGNTSCYVRPGPPS